MIFSTLKSIEDETRVFQNEDKLKVEYLSQFIHKIMTIIGETNEEIRVNLNLNFFYDFYFKFIDDRNLII